MDSKIQQFDKQQIRSVWDKENEKWWFSVLDVIAVLTDQADYKKVRNYWKWLKNKMKEEGSNLFSSNEVVSDTNHLKKENELVSNTNQLKLLAPDGKMRFTDVADIEQILRIIQSIPSKKAEPFKMWLAKVGKERIDQSIDPELSINQAIQNYQQQVITSKNAKELGTRTQKKLKE